MEFSLTEKEETLMNDNSTPLKTKVKKLLSSNITGIESQYGARLDRFVEFMIQNSTDEEISKTDKKLLTRSLFTKHLDKFVLVAGAKRNKGYRPKNIEVIEIDLASLTRLVESVISERAAIEEIVAENDDTQLRIVYENDQFIVIDKKPGIVVHPSVGHSSGTVANLVKGYLRGKGEYDDRVDRAGIVHRLDRGVSGYMVIAKNLEAQNELKKAFEAHEIIKVYSATVRKNRNTSISAQIKEKLDLEYTGFSALDFPLINFRGVVDNSIRKERLENLSIQHISESWIRVGGYIGRDITERKKMRFSEEKVNSSYRESLSFLLPIAKDRLLVNIKTGRTHQIRATLAFCGYSILGDITYGGSKASKKAENRVNEVIMLRSILLSFFFRKDRYLFSESP